MNVKSLFNRVSELCEKDSSKAGLDFLRNQMISLPVPQGWDISVEGEANEPVFFVNFKKSMAGVQFSSAVLFLPHSGLAPTMMTYGLYHSSTGKGPLIVSGDLDMDTASGGYSPMVSQLPVLAHRCAQKSLVDLLTRLGLPKAPAEKISCYIQDPDQEVSITLPSKQNVESE